MTQNPIIVHITAMLERMDGDVIQAIYMIVKVLHRLTQSAKKS